MNSIHQEGQVSQRQNPTPRTITWSWTQLPTPGLVLPFALDSTGPGRLYRWHMSVTADKATALTSRVAHRCDGDAETKPPRLTIWGGFALAPFDFSSKLPYTIRDGIGAWALTNVQLAPRWGNDTDAL